jgi:hypothetical protein
MLEYLPTLEALAPQARVLSCRVFDRRCWHPTPTEAAFAAFNLVTGRDVLDQLPLKWSLQITGANGLYVWTLSQLAPVERAAVEAGDVSLSSLAQVCRKVSPIRSVA